MISLSNFDIKIESTRKGFSKEQLETWVKELHGPEAKISIEELGKDGGK